MLKHFSNMLLSEITAYIYIYLYQPFTEKAGLQYFIVVLYLTMISYMIILNNCTRANMLQIANNSFSVLKINIMITTQLTKALIVVHCINFI